MLNPVGNKNFKDIFKNILVILRATTTYERENNKSKQT